MRTDGTWARGVGTALLAWSIAASAAAQESRRPVVVTEIAGANLYLSDGADAGIAAGDTLRVFADRDGEYLGAFVVVAATATRSVVVFAGSPFPVTRGVELWVALTGEPVGAVAAGSEPERRTDDRARRPARVRGRFSLDFAGLQSTTRWLSNDWQEAERTFATPSASLRLVASDLPGGLTFRTSARGSYRYSDPGIVDPEAALHVYEFSVGNAPGTAPVSFTAGRFAGPEIYSGFWDGVLVRLGGARAGIGAAAGFQPRRYDQAPTGDLPKYAVFGDLTVGSREVRYRTDLVFLHMLPAGDATPDVMTAGWSQLLTIHRFRLSGDVQFDRATGADRWELARLQVTGLVPLARGVYVRGRFDRSQPIQLVPIGADAFMRDRVSLGLGLAGRAGSLTLDAGASRFAEGRWSHSYGGSFSLTRLGVFGLGAHGSGSYWVLLGGTSVRAMAGLNRPLGAGSLRGTYEFTRNDQYGPVVITHAGVLGVTLPIARGLGASVQGRMQWGENLRSNALYVSLWRSF